VRRAGGDVKLLNLGRRSVRVMTITRLLEVFETFDSEKEAVDSFAVRSGAAPNAAVQRGSL
jgi:anti-sigma B factor antagonist